MSGIALLLYFQGKYSDVKGTFVASLIAFFVGAASIIYNIEHWSLIKRSGVHFIIMLITIYPILLLSGWFTIASVFDAVKIFILFAFVGIILWSLFFILARIFSW
ncbi:hypothetical protein AOX59_13530 [Lentibacillus amyloliquefaciens]|uniref:DUF3021 domain-containing protein n=2 Tax=Lentibacillus amyloliquefaciens TaxID=1472767 RepID=A0A0U4DZ10_9BACI|nr:hypothetical protein AOX59_13530 [Lentibacillus amyloliquefaciens]